MTEQHVPSAMARMPLWACLIEGALDVVERTAYLGHHEMWGRHQFSKAGMQALKHVLPYLVSPDKLGDHVDYSPDGEWIWLHREYQPLGFPLSHKVWGPSYKNVAYDPTYFATSTLRMIGFPSVIGVMREMGMPHSHNDSIWLFNDGNPPWRNKSCARAYREILVAVLSAARKDGALNAGAKEPW